MKLKEIRERIKDNFMESAEPLITCFVLTYNKFDTLYKTLESIFTQNYGNIELAVFDDGSKNFNSAEVRDYIDRQKGINIKNVIVSHSKINEGTVINANRMIEGTHGKYLLGLSPDDSFYDNQVCTDVVNYFEKSGAYVVTTYRNIAFNDKDKGISPSQRAAIRFKGLDAQQQFKYIATGVGIAGAGTYYSRKVFEKIGKFDIGYRLQEDGPFFLKITRNNIKIDFYERITYKYVLGAGVSSGNEIHPLLLEDEKKMFKEEVIPYMNRFSPFEKKCIRYELSRLNYHKQLSIGNKIKLALMYFDVMIYRRLNSR